MNLRQLALAGLVALALGGTAIAQVAQPTGTPFPVPGGPAASPSVSPLPGGAAPILTIPPAPASPTPPPAGRRGRRPSTPSPEASPSESPAPPQFETMDGVWEVQMQPVGVRAVYSHLYITQKGDELNGTWRRTDKETLTLTGSFDGRLFKFSLKDAKGATWTMSGYAENYADMVGLLTSSDPKDKGVPFTASHRKKEKLG